METFFIVINSDSHMFIPFAKSNGPSTLYQYCDITIIIVQHCFNIFLPAGMASSCISFDFEVTNVSDVTKFDSNKATGCDKIPAD